METSKDLIAVKSAEYDKFPGLLLGLDGWILRSVPREYRRQFLQGYEKLLRVAFHPDRYQAPAAKRSREVFLQKVSEAVEFMSMDEFSFEVASDAVPTKRNPLVALQQAIDVRDGIIARVSQTQDEMRADVLVATNERQRARGDLEAVTKRKEFLEVQHRRLRKTERDLMSDAFPVPVGCSMHEVRGRLVDLDRWVVGGLLHGDWFEQLEFYSTEDRNCLGAAWFEKGEYKKTLRPFLESFQTIRFLKRMSEEFTIVGAMMVPHLCEFIRAWRYDRPGMTLQDALTFLLKRNARGGAEYEEWKREVFPFTVSYYQVGAFLVLRDRKLGGQRLFLVTSSNYTPNENALAALRYQLQQQEAEHAAEIARLDKLTNKLREALLGRREKVGKLKKDVERLELELKAREVVLP